MPIVLIVFVVPLIKFRRFYGLPEFRAFKACNDDFTVLDDEELTCDEDQRREGKSDDCRSHNNGIIKECKYYKN